MTMQLLMFDDVDDDDDDDNHVDSDLMDMQTFLS